MNYYNVMSLILLSLACLYFLPLLIYSGHNPGNLMTSVIPGKLQYLINF